MFNYPWTALSGPVATPESTNFSLAGIGMDWTVEKRDLSYSFNGATYRTTQQALIRNDTGACLTVVPDRWTPIQHQQAYDVFVNVCREAGGAPVVLGSLDESLLWALGLIPELTIPSIQTQTHLMLVNQYEYGKGIEYYANIINPTGFTYCVPLPSVTRKLAVSVLDTVRKILPPLFQHHTQFQEITGRLIALPCPDKSALSYFTKVFPPSALAGFNGPGDAIKNLFFGLDKKRTWWDAFCSVSLAIDHILGVKPETRLTSSWFGINSKRKQEALRFANLLSLENLEQQIA